MPHDGLFVQCKNPNCSERIRLPYSSLPNIVEGQFVISQNDWWEDFVCPACDLAQRYLGQDVRNGSWPEPGPGQQGSATVVFRIEFRCGIQNCDTPIRLHVTKETGTTVEQVRRQVESRSIAARCAKGHEQTLASMLRIVPVSEV